MSFIKTATSTLVSAGQKGYKVGKRGARLASLNLSLKIERNKQTAYYQEIGEFVHIDQTGDIASSEKIKVLREKIMLQERKIVRLIEEVNYLKRINSCNYCGYILDDGAKYCPRCSHPRK